jgi:hypothetical protein
MGQAGQCDQDVLLCAEIADAIRSIRHGRVELIVQDSRVIQINKTEKLRLDKGQMPEMTGR